MTGYADAPKIALSSVPDLPQDEVLAHLLFGESMKQLSPIQIAEIGAALAELSGVTGGGNPLNGIRKGLGLDRLSVGGGTNGAAPAWRPDAMSRRAFMSAPNRPRAGPAARRPRCRWT